MRTFITRSLLVVVSMALVGACGDDKKVLKKADFIQKADAICAAARVEGKKLNTPKDEKELLALLPKAADIQLKSLAKIVALGEPDTDAAKIKKLFVDLKALFNAAKTSKSIEALQKASESMQPLNKYAREYGFKECGSS